MENKVFKRQAIFPVLMMLVISALALIASSFAWFTIANTAKVAEITTNAQSTSVRLEISKDAITFATRDELVMTSGAASAILPTKLYQVSTAGLRDGESGGLLKFFDTQVNEIYNVGTHTNQVKLISKKDTTVTEASGILSAAELNETNYGKQGNTYGEAYKAIEPTYMVFDLYFHVDRESKIFLEDDSSVVANIAGGSNVSEDLQNSIRVAFLPLGFVAGADGSERDDVQTSDITGLSTFGTLRIWEPYPTKTNNVKDATYGLSSESYDAQSPVKFDAYTTGAYSTATTTYEDSELEVNADTMDITGKVELINCAEAGFYKLRVFIWLEGNDPDCTSAVASNVLKINLSFVAYDPNNAQV